MSDMFKNVRELFVKSFYVHHILFIYFKMQVTSVGVPSAAGEKFVKFEWKRKYFLSSIGKLAPFIRSN